ncbi:hypothetical protein ACROYT_G042020 [Oculina patagonica]
MKKDQHINFIVINKHADSLYSLIADGQYRATSLGRNTWKTLIGSQASLQPNCNKEGFNAATSGRINLGKARIGLLGNNESDCYACDSRIGFGTEGLHDDTNTCGNEAEGDLLQQESSIPRPFVFSQSFRQHVFLKDEFNYLNVPRVGTVAVYDVLDCTFECLRNPLCFSVNLAAKEADEKLWCKLLSSDKFQHPTEYKENKSSHHYWIKSPCSSSPCQNGGTCVTNYEDETYKCLCEGGFIGENCEKVAKSCKELYYKYKSSASQVVMLDVDSQKTPVLCHFGDFGCGHGGWTPVIKIDGRKNTFHYKSGYWSDKNEHNVPGGKTGFDTQETKLPTYWNTSFSKICLGMKIGKQLNFIVINKQANSLYSLIADGQYRGTSLGRNTWKSLIGSQASLLPNCNKEGFNVASTDASLGKARIGILGNNENDCIQCDSRIGFGTGGRHDDSNTSGNEDVYTHIKAMGYILVH